MRAVNQKPKVVGIRPEIENANRTERSEDLKRLDEEIRQAERAYQEALKKGREEIEASTDRLKGFRNRMVFSKGVVAGLVIASVILAITR